MSPDGEEEASSSDSLWDSSADSIKSFPYGASLRVVGLGDSEGLLALITEN